MIVPANIFQPLIDVFEAVLKFFHNNAGISWGWSIVLLTIVIRAVLIPLTLKQFRSMQKLSQLQPELKAVQARYKDDKQRQQQELMKFYKENQVNPLGSCLPLVAQLPVFVSLFYALRQNLRPDICPTIQKHYQLLHHTTATTPCGPHGGASFLFIPDLTNKATGIILIVLIVLYVGTQLASSLMMSSATMDQTQRRIMLLMPLFFVIFIISFPAGVIVYWITTNTWTILQQYIVRRRIGPMGPRPAVTDPSDGGGGGSGGGRGGGGGAGGGPSGGNGTNGSGSGSVLGGLLRGRAKPADDEAAKVGTGGRRGGGGATPPPPPRKKKKRSGRRR